ncbi:MAG: FAD binding domain-containing protein [Kiloniellales bacterium]
MTYLRPNSLAEALDLLAKAPCRILAGGTDLYPATTRSSLTGPILDITAIAELSALRDERDCWRLGATMRWTDVIRADLPAAFDGLKLAAREVGAQQIQNQGTLAGNLCNASPAADGVPPLLTLDAQVELASVAGVRQLPLLSFITGVRQTALRQDEMVTAVLVPKASAEGRSSFLKLGARKYLVISIAMVAVRLAVKDERLIEVALAIGSCSAVARRLPALEQQLLGATTEAACQRLDDQAVAAQLAPIDDIRGSAAYRSRAAAELLRRCLRAAADPQEEERAA